MKLTKKEESKDLQLKVHDLRRAMAFYSKLCQVEFESDQFENAMEIAEDAVKIEDASKAHAKLEKVIQQSAEASRKDNKIPDEVMLKYVKDMEALNDQFITIKDGLRKVDKDIIAKLKLTPLDIMVAKNKLAIID